MPERQIDPARLEGEALRRWYLRSPDEIEQERQARPTRVPAGRVLRELAIEPGRPASDNTRSSDRSSAPSASGRDLHLCSVSHLFLTDLAATF